MEMAYNGYSKAAKSKRTPAKSASRSTTSQPARRKAVIPELCTYNNGCSRGEKCLYAHNTDELKSCIEQLNRDYDMKSVRKPPKGSDTIHPYEMCPDYDASCKWGKNCENAHNDQELKEWERMRKAQQSKKSRVRPVRMESKAKKCEKFSANGCTEGCEFAHGEEEERAWRAALEKPIVGPPVSVPYCDQTKSYSYSIDPFMIGTLDFQRRFGDAMSNVLQLLVKAVFRIPKNKDTVVYRNMEGKCIDPSTKEGEKDASIYDFYRLVEHIKRHCLQYAEYLGTKPQHIKAICSDLQVVRNDLAHARYIADDHNQAHTRHRSLNFTAQYFDRCLELVKLVEGKHSEESVKWNFDTLYNIRASFTEFTLSKSRQNKPPTSPERKKDIAENAIRELQRLVASGDSTAVDFAYLVLAPRITMPGPSATKPTSSAMPSTLPAAAAPSTEMKREVVPKDC